MRIIFTLYFILLSFIMIAQVSEDLLPVAINSDKTNPDKTVRIRCSTGIFSSRQPLVVIDGIPVEYEKLGDLDPNDIETIAVLKNVTASAIYGCRAANGVVIITTKNARIRKFQVKDFLEGSNVAGATVYFVSGQDKKDTLIFASNDSGLVVTDKLKAGEEYEIKITSVGYKSLSVLYKNIGYGISRFSLQRQIVSSEPVIVTAYGRTIRCSWNGCWLVMTGCRLHVEKSGTGEIASAVYPNPVQRGQAVTIEINSYHDILLNTRVVAIDGRQLFSQVQKIYKGINRLYIGIGNRWPAGIYFLQVVDDRKNIIKQEKIIVE